MHLLCDFIGVCNSPVPPRVSSTPATVHDLDEQALEDLAAEGANEATTISHARDKSEWNKLKQQQWHDMIGWIRTLPANSTLGNGISFTKGGAAGQGALVLVYENLAGTYPTRILAAKARAEWPRWAIQLVDDACAHDRAAKMEWTQDPTTASVEPERKKMKTKKERKRPHP